MTITRNRLVRVGTGATRGPELFRYEPVGSRRPRIGVSDKYLGDGLNFSAAGAI